MRLLPQEETSRGPKKMPGGRRSPPIMDPSWKGQNPVTIAAILTVLIWAFLCKKGLASQNLAFTLAVPASVSVQRGLCIHIPCQFTYDRSKGMVSGKLYGYWFQKREGSTKPFSVLQQPFHFPGILVATSDNTQRIEPSFENRFQLTGNLEEGDCSFSIVSARLQDTGEYIFQIAGSIVRFIYLTGSDPAHVTLQVLVTEFTEKPEIVKSSAVIPGKEAILTCVAPGPCYKIEPKISWETSLIGNRTSLWSQQENKDCWTYGSNFTFTPSLKDQGQSLTCRVRYPHIRKQVENTIFLDVATTDIWGPSATLLIVLCLFKVLFCFLFFFLVIWFSNQRKVPLKGE